MSLLFYPVKHAALFMKVIPSLLACLLLCLKLPAQNYEKITVTGADSTYSYYLAIKPLSNNIQGAMVLLPGFGSNAESILPETMLHNVACVNNILTIVLNTGQTLYADTAFITGINNILADVIKKYGVESDKFVIGGHSAGGTLALRYTELCKQYPALYPVQPQGVFSVDGPVDLINLYHYFEREIKKNYAPAGVNEAVYVKGLMDKELGPLKDNLQKYAALSPFYALQDTAGNERYLDNVAVRVYHDADIVWMLQNRRRSLYDMNALASSELINTLLLQGNNKAEYVPGKPGYRSNGMQHPHSWSIVNEIELVQWVKKLFQSSPGLASQSYNLATPGWNEEKSKFPLQFAPSIALKGIDDIRFNPGFYDSRSPGFWTYCFLWYLDGNVTFTATQLQQILAAYYNGLGQVTSSTVKARKTNTAKGYNASFVCTVKTIDKFVTKKAIQLNVTVSTRQCGKKTIAFFSISPQPFTSAAWLQLNTIRDGVDCAAGRQ
ncbi:MAG TPA: alpha/beta hydrolase [Chitinophagaceae bacterium]|nr:alpha/beta hydrolase [Chitinophagaceae bacterium]